MLMRESSIKIDTRAGAAYLRVRKGDVRRTKEVLPEVFVNYDGRDRVLGVELSNIDLGARVRPADQSRRMFLSVPK